MYDSKHCQLVAEIDCCGPDIFGKDVSGPTNGPAGDPQINISIKH